ncbi:MAG TPA: dihydroorotase, partial [bacterium]|nr:dihydroorotase [bacterium]
IKKRSEDQLVDVYPIAAITKQREGKEITEMADLLRAGAVAFSDDGSPVQNAAVMRHALEYASMYGALVIDHCEDEPLSASGHMNEGRMSTRLGLAGIPDISEEIMIARDISLAEYTGGRIHIAHLSTRKGVERIRRAKEAGIQVTCEVTPHHLALNEEMLSQYDTNLKMGPPLRTPSDQEALLAGLKDGTIDVFASDHAPHSAEEKEVEFSAAPNGILGLQTMLGIVLSKVVQPGVLSLADALTKMIITPRTILRLEVPQIREGEPANFTILNPEKTWTMNLGVNRSRSRNMPYFGWTLPGVLWGVCNKGRLWIA